MTRPGFSKLFSADDSLETLSGNDDPSWIEEHKRGGRGLKRTFTVPGPTKKRTRGGTVEHVEKSRATAAVPQRPLAPLMPLRRVKFASQVETKMYCIESSQDSELLSQDLENVCFVQVLN